MYLWRRSNNTNWVLNKIFYNTSICSTVYFFCYFDAQIFLLFQKRREKGRISLETVHSVERTFINLLKDDKGAVPQGYDCPFLIGYQYQGDDYVLHLIVKTDEDRLAWICKLREGK